MSHTRIGISPAPSASITGTTRAYSGKKSDVTEAATYATPATISETPGHAGIKPERLTTSPYSDG